MTAKRDQVILHSILVEDDVLHNIQSTNKKRLETIAQELRSEGYITAEEQTSSHGFHVFSVWTLRSQAYDHVPLSCHVALLRLMHINTRKIDSYYMHLISTNAKIPKTKYVRYQT